MEYDDFLEIEVLDENLIIGQLEIRAKNPYNLSLAQRPRIDLSGTSGENPLNELVKPVRELAKSMTEIIAKCVSLRSKMRLSTIQSIEIYGKRLLIRSYRI